MPRMRRTLLLAVLLGAIPAFAQPRLLSNEVSAGVGVEGIGYTATDGRWGDLFIAPDLAGHILFGGFTLDGDLLLSVPPVGGGASFGANLTARLGWTGEHWGLLIGPVLS